MSPGATLLAFNITNDLTEMTSAFVNTNNHFRISNHSYGRHAGWGGWTNYLNRTYPIWWGVPSVNATEDYKFGFYGEYLQGIDDIAWWCHHYLSVWIASNERHNLGRPYGLPDIDGRLLLSQVNNRYFALANQVTINIANGITTFTTNTIPAVHFNAPPLNDFNVNSGYDLLVPQAVAKNNLVVGAVHKIPGGYGTLTTNVVTITNVIPSPVSPITIVTTTNVV